MSSDIIARVDALDKKADELREKGHLLRAAENFGRAAEAACALGKDNLVALYMQMLRAGLLSGHVLNTFRASTADPRFLATLLAECMTLRVGAVEALERRRLAGTLLEGKCTAAEEAWYALLLQRLNSRFSAAEAASFAALVGYETYLEAASSALDVLLCAPWYAADCSGAQLQFFAQHVVHAVELMQQPRRHGDEGLGSESKFTNMLRGIGALAAASRLDARLVQQLADALQRLERSGVLQPRRIDEGIRKNAFRNRAEAQHAAVTKSLTAPGLRRCALPGCCAKEAHPAHFKSCAACRTVVYCCREHQVTGWPAHKKACKAARKAAEEEEEDDDGAGPSGA